MDGPLLRQGEHQDPNAKTNAVKYKQQRKLQTITDKLTYIQLILASLYNIRTKWVDVFESLVMY